MPPHVYPGRIFDTDQRLNSELRIPPLGGTVCHSWGRLNIGAVHSLSFKADMAFCCVSAQTKGVSFFSSSVSGFAMSA